MSSVKRDSAMADIPWPSSTARSSASATAILTMNPSNSAVISDPTASEMTHDDIGNETLTTPSAPTGTPSYIPAGAPPTYPASMGDYFSIPFASGQKIRACMPNTSDLAYSTSSQDRAVHTMYFKIWNPDSPHRPLFIQEINQRGYIKQSEPELFFFEAHKGSLANRL